MKHCSLTIAMVWLGVLLAMGSPLHAEQRDRPPTVLYFPEIPRDSSLVQLSTLLSIEKAFREADKPEACSSRDASIRYLVFSPIQERIEDDSEQSESNTFRQLLQEKQRLYIVCKSPGKSTTGLWYKPSLNNFLTELRALARQLDSGSPALRDGRILGPEDLPVLTQMASSAEEILKSPGHDLEAEDFVFLSKLLGNETQKGEPSWESFFLSGLDNGFSLLVSDLVRNQARLHLLSGMRGYDMFSIAMSTKDTISIRRIAMNLRDVRRILANSKVRILLPASIDEKFNVQDLVFDAHPCTAFQPVYQPADKQLLIEADCPGRVNPQVIEVSLRSSGHCLLRRWECSDSTRFKYPNSPPLAIVSEPGQTKRLTQQGSHLHTYLLSRRGIQFPKIDQLLKVLESEKSVLTTFFLEPEEYFNELKQSDLVSRMGPKRQDMATIERCALELADPLRAARRWIDLVLSLRSSNEAMSIQIRGQVASKSRGEQRKAAAVFNYIERFFEVAFADKPSVEVELLTLVAPKAANDSKVQIDLYFPPKAAPNNAGSRASLVAVP